MKEPPDLLLCKRQLRKLYDRYPAAFEYMIARFLRFPDHWRDQLPPFEGSGTKPQQVTRHTLVLLLADYRNRQGSREEFKEALAQSGCPYGNPYFTGEWRNADTIENHLKAAEALAKKDPDFEADVEDWRGPLLTVFSPEQSTLKR
jgi:hypothetical protein